MTWLKPDDPPGTAYEFFSPFAHIEGKYEWCRIRSPTHGVFDVFILLAQTTSHPATVYVNSPAGAKFMADRYPQCTTIRVTPKSLRLKESEEGRVVEGRLKGAKGPVKDAHITFRAPARAVPRNVPYGGTGAAVWGAELTCWGVDLVLDAKATGFLVRDNGQKESFRGTRALLTLGSFGRLAPR